MKYIKVGETDIPVLGLGTYLIKGKEAVNTIEQAIDIGYRHIDTAQLYDNESEVGTAIQESPVDRADIFLTTKVWPSQLSKEDFLPSVEDSLRKLKTDYVDLLLVHWPNADIPIQETIAELIKAQEQGKAKHIGVSNFPIALLAKTMGLGAPIICNQVEYHPYIDQSVLKGWMDHNNLILPAYTPLAQGRVFKDNSVQKIADHAGKSIAQVVLRWLIQQENVMAIPKSTNPERLKANLDIFDFSLSEEEMKMMNALSAGNQRFVRSSSDPDWD
ncbi:MAG: 2,5-diketo-D-gluconate reductase B [Saprospiraceae bacterium]|jgi:2,5-diketo-D-gluconate reductase B